MRKLLYIHLTDGEQRVVSEDGRIVRINMHGTGGTYVGTDRWIFLGFSEHNFSNRITYPLAEVFADPSRLVNPRLYGWDRDHGTLRQWASPRIESAYVKAVK